MHIAIVTAEGFNELDSFIALSSVHHARGRCNIATAGMMSLAR